MTMNLQLEDCKTAKDILDWLSFRIRSSKKIKHGDISIDFLITEDEFNFMKKHSIFFNTIHLS